MAMREPVAMDFMGVGPANSNGSRRNSYDDEAATTATAAAGSSGSGCLVRPIPKGGHAWRSSLEAATGVAHPFASPASNLHGPRKQPWNRRFKTEEEHFGGMTVVSPKRERASPDMVRQAQAHHSSDNSAPASPSHQYPGEFWRMHQLQGRSVRPMCAGQQQAAASRQQQAAGAPRTSPFRDDASQRGAQPGPEHPPQPQAPSSQAAFGSPTPFHYQANGTAGAAAAMAMATAKQRSSFRKIPFQPGNLPNQAVARSAAGGGKLQSSTAQLTIFYAGIVNVYDDVPFDKAQAIMLVAGSSNSWSPNFMTPPVASGGAAGRNPFRKSPMSVPQSRRSSSPGLPVASPPQVPTTAAHPPRVGVVFSNVRQPPATNGELPQARKASLARFLEKRKDRVRKAPVNEEGEAASASASASASRDKSPDPALAMSKPASRSPSPTPTVQDQHRASPASSVQQHRRDPPSCSSSEPSSPPTKPPSTPPRQNLPDCEKRSPTPIRKGGHADQSTTTTLPQSKSCKRARSARSPHRLPDPDDSSL